MNLPGAIEALDSNPGLPEGIQSKMNIMKSEVYNISKKSYIYILLLYIFLEWRKIN